MAELRGGRPGHRRGGDGPVGPSVVDIIEPRPILEAHGLVKAYGRVVALDHAEFELRPGEVLAVIGDNGAGKSTLIKCLSGAVIPDQGEILLDGSPVQFQARSTRAPQASRPSTRTW